MAGAVHATIKLDGVTLHTLTRPAGGLASDAIAALKTDTGAFLTAHMAESGAATAAAGDDINMLEEEACKEGSIFYGACHVYRIGGGCGLGPAAWRLPALAPAKHLTDARASHLAGELAGHHGRLTLPKADVDVVVHRFYEPTNDWVLHADYKFPNYARPLVVAVQKNDPRLVLTGPPTPKIPVLCRLSLPAHDVVVNLDDIKAAVANPELRDYDRKTVALAVVWERTIDADKLLSRCEKIEDAGSDWGELKLPGLAVDGSLAFVSEDQPGFLNKLMRSSTPIECQVKGCGKWGVRMTSQYWVPLCQDHFSPFIGRHTTTGALTIESWPVCIQCITRWPIDTFAGKRKLNVLCSTCTGRSRAWSARQAAKAKLTATAAIEKFGADAADAETAAKAKAAKLVADHWAEQTCTTALEAYTWGWCLAGDEDDVLQQATADVAVAKFEKDEEENSGGGSAEG